MIVSIAISFKSGALWNGVEDFESAEEGFLYAQERAVKKYGRIANIVVVPHRATGLVMSAEIKSKLAAVRARQHLLGLRAYPC